MQKFLVITIIKIPQHIIYAGVHTTDMLRENITMLRMYDTRTKAEILGIG